MTLYEFATTADDADLHNYSDPAVCMAEQFKMLTNDYFASGPNNGLILWVDPAEYHRNNMTFDEARMLLIFVALATGENCDG